MEGDGEIRASDSDRESVVAILREAHAEGRLTLDEFDERMNAAYSARTWADLRQLTRDLPADPVLGPGGSGGRGDLAWPRQAPYPFRRPRFGPVLPLAVIWLALAAASQPASMAVIAGVLIFLICLRLAARTHPHPPSRGAKPRPSGLTQRGP